MRTRKLWGFVLPVALVAGALITVPQITAPTPAVAAPATILSPVNPIRLERFNYYSSVPTKFVRPVVLQKKVGSSWRTIFSGHTAVTGKFRFTVHTGSVDTLRSYSVKTTYRGKSYGAVATAPVTVRPLSQAVSLSITTAGASSRATATATPARAGRGLTLQRQNGTKWVTAATGKADAHGRGTFTVPTSTTTRYRVVAAGWNGAPAITSAPPIPASETTLDPADPIKLERFNYYTSVPTQFIRPVVLQKKVGTRWTTIFSGHTGANGRFRFTVHTGSVDTLRAWAAPVTYQGTRYPQVSTTPVTVHPLAQSVRLAMPAKATVNQALAATITATPARSGRTVQVQVQSKTGWTTLSSGTLPAAGPATLHFTAVAQGTFSYRVLQAAWNGAPAVASGTAAMTIGADQVKIADNARALSPAESKAVTGYTPSTGTIVMSSPPAKAIKAGDVVAVPPRKDAPSGALVKVTKVTDKSGATTLVTTPTTLPDVVPNVPDDAATIGMTVSSMTFTPTSGVTATTQPTAPAAGQRMAPQTRGIVPVSAAAVKLGVDKSAKVGKNKDTTLVLKGGVSLTPLVELALNTDWGTVKGYTVGLGYGIDSGLESSASVASPDIPPLVLGTAHWSVAGAIGPVPVWMDVDATVQVTFTASGKVVVSAKISQSGQSVSGITQTGLGNLTPKPYSRLAVTKQTPVSVSGSGSLGVDLGMNASASMYSVGGPFVEAGWRVTTSVAASIGTSGTSLSCSFQQGPYISFGIQSSSFLTKLIKTPLQVAKKLEFPLTKTSGCPGVPTPPADLGVTTGGLGDATVGTAYSAGLQATGGVAPYSWQASGLPAGLSLNASSGAITGTPTAAGTRQVSVTVRDAKGNTATRSLSITVKSNGSTPPPVVVEYVDIPDANLLKCVDTTLGLSSGTRITTTQAASITNLACHNQGHNQGVVNLQGLQQFRNLNSLSIQNEFQGPDVKKVTDITPLKGLINLTNLSLYGNKVSDLDSLKGLTNLTQLDLSGNQVSDLDSLKDLTNLTNLVLTDNRISDVAPLKGLTHLDSLDLAGEVTTNNLDDNQMMISDVGPLKSLTNLTFLDLGNNRISDVAPLKGLTNLRWLGLLGNRISDLAPLKGLTKLTSLRIGNDQIGDITALRGLTNLSELWIQDTQISDFSPLKDLTNLTNLYLDRNSISDLTPLKDLTNLIGLYLDGNRISDVAPLKNLTKLWSLHLNDNQISDVAPLKNLTKLEDFQLSGNPICTVSPSTKGC
jgi:Leucine-rich repeat (LRR) protein